MAGGYLTFDKNVPLGTSWFVAIEMLAPHLPAGFVPEPFPVRLYNGFRLGATASKCLWIDNDYRLMISEYIHLIIIRVALLNRPRHKSTGQN